MSEHRQDPRGTVADIPDIQPRESAPQHPAPTHRHLLGHLIVTILLAALAAVAAWVLLTSPPAETKGLPRAAMHGDLIG